MDLFGDECASLCKDDPAGAHKDCMSSNTDCVEVARCLGLSPKVVRAFDYGPSGLLPRRLAGAFTVTTQNGEFVFQDRWTGQESFVFVRKFAGDSDSESLWKSSLGQLLAGSPQSVHYFFAATREPDGSDKVAQHVATLAATLQSVLAKLSVADRTYWLKHVHLLPGPAPTPADKKPIQGMSGWLADVWAKRGVHAIAIDRFQRVRAVGQLHDGQGDAPAWQLSWLAHEVRHFDFEDAREKGLAAAGATVVPVLKGAATVSTTEGYADLPAQSAMAKFDTLEVDVALHCPQNLDSNCGEVAHNTRLLLCDLPSAATPDHAKTDCPLEIARWMAPQGREGRWVTDISPMLAHIQGGGQRRFRWSGAKQAKKCFPNKLCIDTKYVPHVQLRLRDMGKGLLPVKLLPAFDGGAFSAGYNTKYEPLTFDVPKGAKKVLFYALLTGHGWQENLEQCAEFCEHSHHISIGGKTFVRDHSTAGKAQGCQKRLDEGVVPNQFGDWHWGRAGWCPGLDVQPWTQDITAQVNLTGSNSITYKALVNGKPYEPKPPKGKSSATGGTINMRSYIVFLH